MMFSELGVFEAKRQVETWTPYAWMARPRPDVLNIRIMDLTFSSPWIETRVWHLCVEERINTLGDLCECTELRLLRRPNLGRKTLNELKSILAEHGLSLRAS